MYEKSDNRIKSYAKETLPKRTTDYKSLKNVLNELKILQSPHIHTMHNHGRQKALSTVSNITPHKTEGNNPD